MQMDEGEFIPTRQTLLSRLKRWSDHDSWQEFFDTYWKLIYGVCLRYGLTHDEAQEIVQETVVTVAKQMPSFQYRPDKVAFKSWLYQITKCRIIDFLRKNKRWREGKVSRSESTDRTATLERVADPSAYDGESIWQEEWEKNLVDNAMRRIKTRVRPKQYQIFDMYVVKELSPSHVMQALNVSRAQVYLAKHRVSALIKKEVDRLEAEWNARGKA